MEPNVGNIDRVARIVVGLVILSGVFVLDEPQRWLGMIGIVPLATGILRVCPAYAIFGIDTCSASRKPA